LVHNSKTFLKTPREEATLAATSFYLREVKDDNKVILEDKDLEVIGVPNVRYDDVTVIAQHMETGFWLSYKAYQVKKKGVGLVEEKRVILHEEGRMDDGCEFARSQEEEAKTARVIRLVQTAHGALARDLWIFYRYIWGYLFQQQYERPG
jgi:ryanodine receptor 2